jgi:diguanylate cyclase (GGDEF)-like protein/PAS domain S-box-containing protein
MEAELQAYHAGLEKKVEERTRLLEQANDQLLAEIEERKRAEEASRESDHRYRMLFNAIDDGFCIIEVIFNEQEKAVDYRFLEVNPSFEKQTGLSDVQGKTIKELLPQHEEHWFETYGKIAMTGEPARFENIAERLHRWYDVYAFRFGRPEDRQVAVLFSDITERKQSEQEINHLAHHDPLTALPNRRLFTDILKVEIAQSRRHKSKLAVLFLDLDRFKNVNDTLGHEVGDELLKEVAHRFRKIIRESDTVSRIGGDEFNMVMADVARTEDIADFARKIIQSLRSPVIINGTELNITTSIGISVYPDDSEETDVLRKYADIAMYHAKQNGRNQFQFYNPSINVRSLERMQLERMLRRSIDAGELVLHYQPQVTIAGKRMVCAEALVRWRHPEQGFLLPGRFLPLAEETGFITEIDDWALRTVCRQARSWIDSGLPPVCITVNLSARRFQSPDLAAHISSVLAETRMPPGCLDIEVTESLVMSDAGRTASQLRSLLDMGVHISIDDFGTGYSSLNYLKRLPIERLKIDQSFIRDIADDPDDRAIIQAVTAMAHNMKMKVVAEGVETEEQLAFLNEAGCDEMQGFLFSEPLPPEEFRELILRAA